MNADGEKGLQGALHRQHRFEVAIVDTRLHTKTFHVYAAQMKGDQWKQWAGNPSKPKEKVVHCPFVKEAPVVNLPAVKELQIKLP